MLDHASLQAILPQRYPMLLIDRVVRVEPRVSITAVKAITAVEPCYRDLPDGTPPSGYAYPVSLLVESFGQAAAILWFLDRDELSTSDDAMPMLAVVRDYRVHGEAYPGDVVRHEVRLDHAVDGAAFGTGEILVGDRVIATVGSLLAVVRPRSSLLPEPAPAVLG
ncbi:MAG TPA: beta-hydroxyacyl-ACP dehydratase [Pilimelia sp.]|nr:beta-hydroxyacyl-ACP dehydratase [Pilimelia sp.]